MRHIKLIGQKTGKPFFAFAMPFEEFTGLDEDNCGLCIRCGELTVGGVEPDARKYECECCGENGVYGMQELLMMDLVRVTEEEEEGGTL
jgi:hypothetical protein